jgi:hypothetical protein
MTVLPFDLPDRVAGMHVSGLVTEWDGGWKDCFCHRLTLEEGCICCCTTSLLVVHVRYGRNVSAHLLDPCFQARSGDGYTRSCVTFSCLHLLVYCREMRSDSKFSWVVGTVLRLPSCI